jgi:hypothetical protein
VPVGTFYTWLKYRRQGQYSSEGRFIALSVEPMVGQAEALRPIPVFASVSSIQENHPDTISEGSKCTGSEVSYRLKSSPARLTAKKIMRYKYLLPTLACDLGLTNEIIIAPLSAYIGA